MKSAFAKRQRQRNMPQLQRQTPCSICRLNHPPTWRHARFGRAMDFQPFKPFQAFVNAASFSPTSPQKPRPRSARAGGSAPRVRLDRFFLPLPTPTPPSTRLAKEQAEPGELTAIDAAWATETIKVRGGGVAGRLVGWLSG